MTRIGQILVSLGKTTENNIARALGVQGFAGGRLGTLLLERGSVTEDDLGEALAQQHGRPYVPWAVLGEVPPDVIASLPAKFAIRHSAVPFERSENTLKIALRDPGDLRILDELFFVTGRKILSAVAPEARIYHALEKYYGERRTPRYAILSDKLSRSMRRKTPSGTPPPPPDFFPPGQQRTRAPQPHEVWGDAAESDLAEAPIIQRWKIPDAPPIPWAKTPPSEEKAAPEPPEEESITWESPPPELWLFEERAVTPEEPSGEPAPFEWPDAAVTSSPGERPEEDAPVADLTLPAAALPEIFVAAPLPAAPEPAALAGPAAETARVPPSEADFPEVVAARGRDDIAAAALAALSRRFGRAAFFVVRPAGVAGHSATGPGIDCDALQAISIPWSEPSVFLNVRLSRALYLGPLLPMARHRPLIDALGGEPEECLVQPVMMKDKPVAFLFAEFGRDQGATPMDLAYMRGLAAAAAGAFAAAIRQKKKEPV